MPDGSLQRFFCKYGSPTESAEPAQRFGLAYEARVYDGLLDAWADDVPRLHGAVLDEAAQTLVLALDYLEGGAPLNQVAEPKSGLLAAARWIARFHLWGEAATVPAFLRRYDTEFYRLWLRRAADSTRCLHDRYSWLPELCERGIRRLPALLPPATIIHGQYQAENIVVCQERNMVTDWQSAALATGEIDLASLTWACTEELALLCQQQYCLVRWPDDVPDDFTLRLTAAQVFLRLRRLVENEGDEESAIRALDELSPLAAKFAELDY
jgi:hypothetical protein